MRHQITIPTLLFIGLTLASVSALSNPGVPESPERVRAVDQFAKAHKLKDGQAALAAVKTEEIKNHNQSFSHWKKSTRTLNTPKNCSDIIPWICAANQSVDLLLGEKPLPGCRSGLEHRMTWDKEKWSADQSCVGLYKMAWRAAERFDAFARQQQFETIAALEVARRLDTEVEDFLFAIVLGRATRTTVEKLHCGNLTQVCQPHLWSYDGQLEGEWAKEAHLLNVIPPQKEFCNAVSAAGLLYAGPRPKSEPVCHELHMAYDRMTDRDNPTSIVNAILKNHAWQPFVEDTSNEGARRFRFLEEN